MKISIKQGQMFAVILYLFFLSFMNFTPLYLAAAALIVAFTLLRVMKKGYMTGWRYAWFELLFIGYNFLYVVFGITLNQSHTVESLKTMVLNFAINFFIINCIDSSDDINRILKCMIKIAIFSNLYALAYTAVLGFGEGGRLMHGMPRPLGEVYSAMEFASWAIYASTMCIYMFSNEKNKRYLIPLPLFWLVTLLSGSRKWLLFGAMLQIFVYLYCNKTVNTKKFLKRMCMILALVAVGIYAVLKIPALYETIGSRIVGFVLGTESSSLSRNYLTDTAIQYIKIKPWFGYGLNTFRDVNMYKNWSEVNYLELAFGGGLILVAIYYGYILSLIISLFKARKRSPLYLLLMFIMAMIAISDIVSMSYLQRLEQFFIALSSIALVIDKKERRYEDLHSNPQISGPSSFA